MEHFVYYKFTLQYIQRYLKVILQYTNTDCSKLRVMLDTLSVKLE